MAALHPVIGLAQDNIADLVRGRPSESCWRHAAWCSQAAAARHELAAAVLDDPTLRALVDELTSQVDS